MDRTTAKIGIVTSMSNAINLYPFIHGESGWSERNRFLSGMVINFRHPKPNQAEITDSAPIPKKTWFVLFDDAEKEILEDEYAFYGVQYKTTVKLAKKRVEKVVEKLEVNMNDKAFRKEARHQNFYQLDELKHMSEALNKFSDENEVVMNFLFSEWPDIDKAKRMDYVKEYEGQILNRWNDLNDIPF